MKLSIIIPTLNEEKLLPELLKQLTNPSLRDTFEYEIIISDGGSKDLTTTIARNYTEKIVLPEKNKKQNIAIGRNRGASFSKGEILIFLNGDTTIADPIDFFNLILNDFVPGKYLAMTSSVIVSPPESKRIDKIFQSFYNNYFYFLNVVGMGMGRGECHVIRREIFEKFSGYNENLAAGEDFELYTRIRKEGKILFAKNIYIHESPRRYRKFGHFRILFAWLINSIFVFLSKKSHSKTWEQVR